MKINRVFKNTVRRNPFDFFVSFFLDSILGIFVNILINNIYKKVIDISQNGNAVMLPILIQGGIIILTYLIHVISSSYFTPKFYTLFEQNLKTEYVIRIPNIEKTDNGNTDSGSIVRNYSGTSSVSGLLRSSVAFIITIFTLIGTVIYICVSLSWHFLIFFIILMPIAIFLKLQIDKLENISRDIITNEADAMSMIDEGISGLEIIKIYNLQGFMTERFSNTTKHITDKQIERDTVNIKITLMQQLVMLFTILVIPVYGGYLYNHSYVSLGAIIIADNLFMNLLQNIGSLVGFIQGYKQDKPLVEIIKNIFRLDTIQRSTNNESISEPVNIEVKNLKYQYNSSSCTIDNFNIFFPAKSLTLIVGPSGSGKTTLLKLLCGLLTPDSGNIYFDGNIVSHDTILNSAAYVEQFPRFFPVTVNENIGYGHNSEIEAEEIKKAAEFTGADKFINTLENKYNYILNQNVTNLSGGQKQLLGLTRALTKDSGILILDEPLSAQDYENCKMIQRQIYSLANEKNIIVVSHILKGFENAAQIVVMEAGKIADIGRHEDLLKRCSLYKKLYSEEASL